MIFEHNTQSELLKRPAHEYSAKNLQTFRVHGWTRLRVRGSMGALHPHPSSSSCKAAPRPGMVSPGAREEIRPLASTQGREGASGPELPSPRFHLARPGRERPSRSPSSSSRRRASSSDSAQPNTPPRLGACSPLPGSKGRQLGQRWDRRLWLQPAAADAAPHSLRLTWKGVGVTRPSHLAPTATQRGHAFSVLRLRSASTLQVSSFSPRLF